jgi:lysyl-tRNA synthetase class 2
MGKRTFVDLRDGSGKIQADLRQDVLGDADYDAFADLVDLGDFVGVTGTLFRTRTGEPTVETRGYTILTKALRAPPEKWHGLQDVEIRYRQRYLTSSPAPGCAISSSYAAGSSPSGASSTSAAS